MESGVKFRRQSESHSVVSDSLQPHGLYTPGNSLGENTGVGNLSLLQGIFPTQGSNQGLLHCRWILYQLICQRSPQGIKQSAKSGYQRPRGRCGEQSGVMLVENQPGKVNKESGPNEWPKTEIDKGNEVLSKLILERMALESRNGTLREHQWPQLWIEKKLVGTYPVWARDEEQGKWLWPWRRDYIISFPVQGVQRNLYLAPKYKDFSLTHTINFQRTPGLTGGGRYLVTKTFHFVIRIL